MGSIQNSKLDGSWPIASHYQGKPQPQTLNYANAKKLACFGDQMFQWLRPSGEEDPLDAFMAT